MAFGSAIALYFVILVDHAVHGAALRRALAQEVGEVTAGSDPGARGVRPLRADRGDQFGAGARGSGCLLGDLCRERLQPDDHQRHHAALKARRGLRFLTSSLSSAVKLTPRSRRRKRRWASRRGPYERLHAGPEGGRAGLSSFAEARQTGDPGHQAARQPARPRARLLARRRLSPARRSWPMRARLPN